MADDLLIKLDVQKFMGIETLTGAQDSQVDILIPGIQAAIENYTGRSLLSAEATEIYDGNNARKLILRRYPVTAVGEVKYTDENDVITILALGDYKYDGDAGILLMKANAAFSTVFIKNELAWSVKYTAGYTAATLPKDIKLAWLKWIAITLQKIERKLLAVQSESMGDQNITYLNEDIPKDVALLLDRYRRVYA